MPNPGCSFALPEAEGAASPRLGRRELLAGLLATGAVALAGCGPKPAPPSPPPQLAPIAVGPLTELVSTTRLEWLLATRPAALFSQPDLRGPLSRLLRDERLELFANTTGLELRSTQELLVASFVDESLLLLARHNADPIALERLFRARLTGDEQRSVDHERVVRVTGRTGRLGRAFVALGQQVVGLQFGGDLHAGPARVAELYATGSLARVPTVRGDPIMGPCWDALGDTQVRWLCPGPFEEPMAHGARGLLGSATALAASLASTGGGGVRLVALIDGDFDGAPQRATELLARTWQDLSQSDLGHLLGLGEPRQAPQTQAQEGRLRLTVTIDADALCKGLAAATMNNVREIMR